MMSPGARHPRAYRLGWIISSVLTLSLTAHGGTELASVPVEGQLSTATPQLTVGQTAELSFVVVLQAELPYLALEVKLPDGLRLIDGERYRIYRNRLRGEWLELKVRVQVVAPGPQRVLGSVTVADLPALTRRRAFVLDINPAPVSSPAPRRIRDTNRTGYVLY